MKILLSILLSFTLVVGIMPLQPAYAQNQSAQNALNFLDKTADKGGLNTPGGDSRDRIVAIIGNIINVVLGFVGIIFFIQIMWAGIRWMTAGGNEQVIEESKQTLKASVIGIVIALSAFLITNFVLVQVRRVVTTTYIETNFIPHV